MLSYGATVAQAQLGQLAHTNHIFPQPTGFKADLDRDAQSYGECGMSQVANRFCWLKGPDKKQPMYSAGNIVVGYEPSDVKIARKTDAEFLRVQYISDSSSNAKIGHCLEGKFKTQQQAGGFGTLWLPEEPKAVDNLANLRCLEDSQISAKASGKYESSTVFDNTLNTVEEPDPAKTNILYQSLESCKRSSNNLGFCKTEDGIAYIANDVAVEMSDSNAPFLDRPLLRVDMKGEKGKLLEACFKNMGDGVSEYSKILKERATGFWTSFRFRGFIGLKLDCLRKFFNFFKIRLTKDECSAGRDILEPKGKCSDTECKMSYKLPGSSELITANSSWPEGKDLDQISSHQLEVDRRLSGGAKLYGNKTLFQRFFKSQSEKFIGGIGRLWNITMNKFDQISKTSLFGRPGVIIESTPASQSDQGMERLRSEGSLALRLKKITTAWKGVADDLDRCVIKPIIGCKKQIFNLFTPEWTTILYNGDYTPNSTCFEAALKKADSTDLPSIASESATKPGGVDFHTVAAATLGASLGALGLWSILLMFLGGRNRRRRGHVTEQDVPPDKEALLENEGLA